jgi:phosphatidylinositol 4-kinase
MSAPDEILQKEVGQWAQVSVASSLQAGKASSSGKGLNAISKWLSETKGGFGVSSEANDAARTRSKLSERSIDGTQTVSDGSAPGTYGTMRRDVMISSKDSHRSMSADARIGGNFTAIKAANKDASETSGSTEYKSDYSGVIRMSYDDGEDFAIGRYNSEVKTKSPASSDVTESGQPPLVVFKEAWVAKQSRIQASSPVGSLPGWRLLPIIVKSGDDLRQEQVVSQLIFQMYFILKKLQVGVWIRPYGIIATSADSGVIEAIPDTVSLDVLRRCVPSYTSLLDFYERFYGDRSSEAFRAAKENFVKSLAGYSIICYLLQIKDRHNGNILIDNRGHIMHIDFGFVFGLTPGGNMGFEKAPFKLTQEMIDLMGGLHSSTFHKYRDYCVKTFMALRKEHNRIVLLLEMMSYGSSHLKFFGNDPHHTIEGLRARFCPDMNDSAAIERVHQLIDAAANNWTTTCYDKYQRYFTGVL